MNPPPEFVLFLGRFHPVFVHLPIGLIVAVALLELAAKFTRWKAANSGNGYILALAVPGSILTALFGWLLSLAGGYEEKLLQLHLWTGIATAIMCSVAAGFYWFNLKRAYGVSLAVSMAVLIVASHNGGSLTHGSDYLVKHAPSGLRALLGATPKASPVVMAMASDTAEPIYNSVVHPMLDKYCVSCHGPEKTKGGLRLDTYENLLKGGDNGKSFVSGNSAESLIIKRLKLPLSDDEHMPPDGKPQPTTSEVTLLQWWIDQGGSASQTLAEATKSERIQKLLAAITGGKETVAATPAPDDGPKPEPLDKILPVAEKLAAELGVAITPLSQTEAWLQCNASVAGAEFGDESLAKLAPLARNLKWLDLAGTKVSDAGLKQVSAMPGLSRLHLQRTTISDAGLTNLSNLKELSYLNIYGTPVTDDGLQHLESLPALRQVYVWQTKVSAQGVKTFAANRGDEEEVKEMQDQIEQLKKQIRERELRVELGIPLVQSVSAETKPVNTECPVSGKAVDPNKTAVHEGKTVAFCCGDCAAKFQQDPKPFLAKLNLAASPSGSDGPVNKLCPVSGKEINAAVFHVHEGKKVGFCCETCKAKFVQDPKPFIEKLK